MDELEKILRWYREEMPKKKEHLRSLGLGVTEEQLEEMSRRFEWYEVGIRPQKLNKLVEEGILKIVYKSGKHTEYTLAIPLEELEIMVEGDKYIPVKEKRPIEEYFDIIIGYDDIKKIVKMALEAEKPVHCLFVGPPATAKTLLLEAIYNSQDDAEFIVGSEASSAGIGKLIREKQPKILLIDEIDKILKSEDLSTLLSVMESGYTRRVKGDKITDMIKVELKVFAAANRIDKMPAELKSRFLVFYFKPYTYEEFIKVCVGYLARIEGIEEKLARRIAEATWRINRDIRTARYIARLAGSDESRVEFVISVLEKWGKI